MAFWDQSPSSGGVRHMVGGASEAVGVVGGAVSECGSVCARVSK